MRSAPGSLLALTLLVLLAVTTPVGTGGGVHEAMLLHPLFQHVHIVNGQVVTHEQLQAEQDASQALGPYVDREPGQRIRAGAGPDGVEGGVGLSPTLPFQPLVLPLGTPEHWALTDQRPPLGRAEAPPDPPPTSAA